ncbi:MAG: hypothetical protein V8Q32_04405 [Anaerotignum faecicola]
MEQAQLPVEGRLESTAHAPQGYFPLRDGGGYGTTTIRARRQAALR